MPRLSHSQHPIARLRRILGLQQKELAALIKISPRSVQDIERGKLQLSEKMAIRFVILTGVKLDSLMHPERPLLDVTDSPYVAESKQRYGMERLVSYEINFAIERLGLSLGLILEAANLAGQALLVGTEVEMLLREVVEKYELKKYYDRTLRSKIGGQNLKAWRAKVNKYRAGQIYGWNDGGAHFFPWLFAEELVSKKHFKFLQKRITSTLRPSERPFGIDFDDPKTDAKMEQLWVELLGEPKVERRKVKRRSRQQIDTTSAILKVPHPMSAVSSLEG